MLFLNYEVGTFLSSFFSSHISFSSKSSHFSSGTIKLAGGAISTSVDGVSFGVILPKLNYYFKICIIVVNLSN